MKLRYTDIDKTESLLSSAITVFKAKGHDLIAQGSPNHL